MDMNSDPKVMQLIQTIQRNFDMTNQLVNELDVKFTMLLQEKERIAQLYDTNTTLLNTHQQELQQLKTQCAVELQALKNEIAKKGSANVSKMQELNQKIQGQQQIVDTLGQVKSELANIKQQNETDIQQGKAIMFDQAKPVFEAIDARLGSVVNEAQKLTQLTLPIHATN